MYTLFLRIDMKRVTYQYTFSTLKDAAAQLFSGKPGKRMS